MKVYANRKIAVAGIRAKPGERAQGYAQVGELQDHQPARIPIAIVNGARPGPTLYLQAASDGDELNGVAVIHRVLRMLRPETLRGAVIAVPLVNVHAFHAHRSHSPADGKKMNRCFPGNRHGSTSDRVAFFLFHNAVLQADLCIDLHQGGVNPMIDECRVRVNMKDRAGPASFELGRVFGIGYIFHQRGPDGQLARAAPAAGIPTIDPELGGTRGWDAVSIRKGVRGVMNVLQHYGFIAGKPKIPRRQVVVRRFKTVYATRGGFLALHARLYSVVRRGDLLAEIHDPFGAVVERVCAPADGVVWTYPPYPMLASGQTVATIGTPIRYV
ncbi:MAG: succinylglutamate desuccinylase/aspartoacylase family protein [Kiritimatiellae bacterium]|nr:succinylglutamate desuccinylase/aspartoacylase family protein [Kiritimatiellia bacterium]